MKDTSSKITVVVPFRNLENSNQNVDPLFLKLLRELSELSEFVSEVILVNDHSTDHSLKELLKFKKSNWKILTLDEEKSGKKDALELAILEARTEYIWTLDADVSIKNFNVPNFKRFNSKLKEDLVIFPVHMQSGTSLLSLLQSNEWLYLQGITWLSAKVKMPMMCNGANLIFKREVFLNGIAAHKSVSSGDDMFLLSHVLNSKGLISMEWKGFCQVEIFPVKSWLEAFSQRLRWAGKTTKLPISKSTFLHGLFAFLSALHVVFFIFTFSSSTPAVFVGFLVVKVGVEISVMNFVCAKRMSWIEILISIPQMTLYPFFSLLIFISSLFYVPKWKGRRVSLK